MMSYTHASVTLPRLPAGCKPYIPTDRDLRTQTQPRRTSGPDTSRNPDVRPTNRWFPQPMRRSRSAVLSLRRLGSRGATSRPGCIARRTSISSLSETVRQRVDGRAVQTPVEHRTAGLFSTRRGQLCTTGRATASADRGLPLSARWRSQQTPTPPRNGTSWTLSGVRTAAERSAADAGRQ